MTYLGFMRVWRILLSGISVPPGGVFDIAASFFIYWWDFARNELAKSEKFAFASQARQLRQLCEWRAPGNAHPVKANDAPIGECAYKDGMRTCNASLGGASMPVPPKPAIGCTYGRLCAPGNLPTKQTAVRNPKLRKFRPKAPPGDPIDDIAPMKRARSPLKSIPRRNMAHET